MAIKCSYCGNELPQGNARFCNRCGMLIPSHVSQQAQAANNSNRNTPIHSDDSRQSSQPASPDSWSALQRHEQAENKPSDTPSSVPSQDSSSDQRQEASIPQGATPWLGLQPNSITPWLGLPSDDGMPQTPAADQRREGSDAALSPSPRDVRRSAIVPQRPVNNVSGHNEVADPDQSSAANGPVREDASFRKERSGRAGRLVRNTEAVRAPDIDEVSTMQMHSSDLKKAPDIEDMPTVATARPQSPLGTQAPSMPQTPPIVPQTPVAPVMQNPPGVEESFRAAQPARSRRNLFAVVVAACVVLVLIVAGIIFVMTHSSVDVNPLQTMNNATLGVTMSYPTGWHEVDTRSSLLLSDSSNTDQIKIARSGTADSNQALQQVASQIGMTGGKMGSAATFGNCTWQQMSGNFQLQGADYYGVIYACRHNNQTYILVQMSPKSTYADEETLVFAPARASLRLK